MNTTQQSLVVGRPPIVLTLSDRQQLLELLRTASPATKESAAWFLSEELERADIAPEHTPFCSLVRMGCNVKFVDHARTHLQAGRLVYPNEVGDEHCISVLSTVGSALIGLGPGQSISWIEHGAKRKLSVLEITNDSP